MRAIDNDAQPVEAQSFREALLDEFDIAAAGVVEALGATELGRRGAAGRTLVEPGLDLGFEIVGQLITIGSEQFDAVVDERIMRGRNDNADIGAQAARQYRDRR